MEVAKLKDSKTEREVWYVFQASYIKDLISKAGEEVKKKKVPITRSKCSAGRKGRKGGGRGCKAISETGW